MKVRSKLTKTGLLVALLSTTALVSTGAFAQMATKAPPATTEDQTEPWWFHGTVEVGGRGFVNDPEKNGQTALKFGPSFVPGIVTGTQSLGGYYQYSDIAPGVFGNFDLSAGSKNGLYRIDAGGRNVGYWDQSYYFDWSKAGEQYFNFYWDQSPHLYSNSAISPLTRNGNVVSYLPGIPAGTTTQAALQPYGQWTTLGIHRDTAAASYRWTPNDWDINLDYSHMQRTGTQPSAGFTGNLTVSEVQFMRPVDDSTQNYSAKGEYVGTSPWGQRYVFSAGYNGSQYQDSYNSYLVQGAPGSAAYATFANWPSNSANGVASTLSADLPWNTRYVGTLDYTMMRQNASFVDPAAYNPSGQSSLDGGINTLLTNNTLTTKVTDAVTAKTTLRYYDFKNDTAQLFYYGGNSRVATATLDGTGTPLTTYPAYTISMGYIKTNVGEDVNWRPNKYWNLGVAYDFERYDWTRTDVNVTNQNGAKAYADYKPFTWLTSRSSVEFNSRRYENYNNCEYVADFQWNLTSCTPAGATATSTAISTSTSYVYSSTEQQLMYDNRQVWKANWLVDVTVLPNVTLTPWTKYQDANYSVDPNWQQGLQDNRNWNFGVDGVYVVSPDLSFMAGYSRMYGTQALYGSGSTGFALGGTTATPVCNGLAAAQPNYSPQCQNVTNDRNVVDTYIAAVKYTAIPDRLDTELRYTASHGIDDMTFNPTSALYSGTAGLATGQFPENKVWFQRLDATLIYKFDPQQVAAIGWKGDLKAKLNYAWESNSETNWANDPLSLSTASSVYASGTAAAAGFWMGWYNPNYNVQIVSASLIGSW